MPINIPNLTEIQTRISTDLTQSINSGQPDTNKQIDPNLRGRMIHGFVNAMAGGFDGNNDILRGLEKAVFFQTSTGSFLDLFLDLYGISKISAAPASGLVTFSGTATTVIDISTPLNTAGGIEYTTDSEVTISANSLSVVSITRVGTTATVTTISSHNLASGISVTISGAGESEYNLAGAVISVTDNNVFSYQVSGSPATPATGTILASFTTASVSITSTTSESGANANSGSEVILASPIIGVDTNAFVQFTALTGGLDTETDEEVRERGKEILANRGNAFSSKNIDIFIKENVNGVTRVFVQDAIPAPGSVTILFTRDGDANIIPDASEVTNVKNAIIDPDTGIKPASIPGSNVIVAAPSEVSTSYTFTSLSPNTEDMRNAITESLDDFYRNDTIVGVNITETTYNNIIFSTIDSNAETPTFVLSSPVGVISIGSSSIGTLGTITFP